MTSHERAIIEVNIRYFFIATIFGVCAHVLAGGIARPTLLFIVVLVCLILNFSRRWLDRGAMIILILTFLVVFEAVPSPALWRDNVLNIIVTACHQPERAK